MRNLFYFLILIGVASSCSNKPEIDNTNPEKVISQYREYRDNWEMGKAYDLLADTCKAYISKKDYLRYYDRPDSIKEMQAYKTTKVEKILVEKNPEIYSRFSVFYEVPNNKGIDTIHGNWNYTLLNQSGEWKLIWTEQLILAAGVELERNNFDQAMALYGLILDLNPYDDMAYQGMASCYLKNKMSVRAVSYAQKAVNVDPGKAANQKFLSDVYAYFGQYDMAIGAIYAAIKISPRLDYLIDMGNDFKGLSMYFKADSLYNVCLERDPQSTLSLWMKGDLYFHYLDKKDSATYYYEKALSTPPMADHLQSQLYFGYGMSLGNEVYRNEAEYNDSEKRTAYLTTKKYLEMALELAPGNEEYQQFLMQVERDIDTLDGVDK